MIRWLQTNYPQLDVVMAVISQFGRFEFFLAVVPLLYWCIHKQFGKQLAYLLALTNIVNAVVKHALRQPRPFWLEESAGRATEASYGFPSNHAQTATVVYLFVANWVRRGWVWLLAGMFIVLMGLSRVYLGVHFPHDVAAGLVIGLLVLGGYLLWLHFFQDSFRNRILGQRLLFALIVPLAFGIVYVAIRLVAGGPADDLAWSDYVPLAERTSVDDLISGLAILLGMGIGFILEATRVHFVVDGPLLKRAARYLLGIAVTLALWRGLALVFPEDPLWLALPLRFIRYWLASMWVAYYAPAVFIWLRLADASPEPEVQLTISNGSIMRG